MCKIRFGPAGTGESFSTLGFKKSAQAIAYVRRFSLTAYEYQCGRGVRLSDETAETFLREASVSDVKLSLHAPYFISLSSVDAEKRDNSISYILESARAAQRIGADRIIVHTGSATKISREEAMTLAADTLQRAQKALDEAELGNVCICPETMGKLGQLGTLEEVLSLCKLDERMIPCIDFGHLNARTQGSLKSKEDFLRLYEQVENELGEDRARRFHAHFSKIEYTAKGESKHLTFSDTVYGPEFEPLCDALIRKNATPTIICESSGTQAEDAQYMAQVYQKMTEGDLEK